MTRRAWAAFVTVAILWGVPYLFIRIAVVEVSPPAVAWTRLLIATVVLLPFAASRHALGPALKRWPWIALLGAFYMALAWTLIPLAETVLPSSLTAIMIAGVPSVVTIMNLGRERPGRERIAGLVIGFLGVALLVGLDIGVRRSQLLAVGAVALVLVCYAAGPILTQRKLAGIDPAASSGLAAAFATLILTPVVAFQLPHRVPSGPVLLSLAALGFLCSAVALVAWFFLIHEAGPARASIVTYLNPVIAVLAGVVILREHVGLSTVAGMALILAGSYLATSSRFRKPAGAIRAVA